MHALPAPDADTALVWFRRDLRADDHAALYHALKTHRRVFCAFVLDTEILDALPRQDRRVSFILQSLQALDTELSALREGAGLIVRHGAARQLIPALAAELGAAQVYYNHDDEPQALQRDAEVAQTLARRGVAMQHFKDHVIFERAELLTGSGKPYGVFTPYKNAWLRKVDDFYLRSYPVARYAAQLAPLPPGRPALPLERDIGFEPVALPPLLAGGRARGDALFEEFLQRMALYHEQRDFPAVKGPSYLSVHLRFGTLSIRRLARAAWQRQAAGDEGAAVWLSELIWRDFYHQVLHHHPHVVTQAFRPEYDRIRWEQGEAAQALFKAWCEGRTGYPLVDAAMHQLNQTGYMHNRLRMVVASFLIKDLGIDWRWGERYFAQQLLDFDLAANNGGWQWAASSGCDAQPYFRIFNPITQSEKFDPEGRFIRRYLPQLETLGAKHIHAPWLAGLLCPADYPPPLVQHDQARERTLTRYAVIKA
jgi:deoxyribodipyrimidine photo-lyase